MSPANDSDVLQNLKLELRRGTVVLAVLSQLEAPRHGYGLRKVLADQGLTVDENTLYPLLRRLESQGLLDSQWREEEKRSKRFYRLSPTGRSTLAQLLDEWDAIDAALRRLAESSRKRRVR